ncbi:PREDICTED: EMILIN-2 [Nanorana parkeri]|uniref:EMILIN-2 n=1 Tax=Nanorana parkeri TaxID=125878 RepID=UPI000854A011|nr:PREDICTED: EMILIN-2 [Nanorana parkeri]
MTSCGPQWEEEVWKGRMKLCTGLQGKKGSHRILPGSGLAVSQDSRWKLEMMWRSEKAAAGPRLWTVFFISIIGCLLVEGTPQLTYHRPAQRGKNWCAYIVNKNVSCTVMEGTESFIQPQYKCAWNQIHCQPTLAYKVSFRPRYVTSYKVVTELEWRCCPGFKGHDCNDGPADKIKLTPIQTPQPSGGKKETDPNGQQQKAQDSKRELQELNKAQEEKVQGLEDEVLRLTQTMIDLQTSVSGVNENLKITVQEDVSKFLNEWLNNLRPTASATGGKTEYFLPGFSGSAEREDGIKDIVSELTTAQEELQTKTKQIEDLTRKINLYEERLIELEKKSHEPTKTVSTANVLQTDLDDKLEALTNEMMEGMDRKMADLKNSCEYNLINIQQQCEENENSCSGVKELVLEKETELRNEINKLKSQMQTVPNGSSGCCKTADFDATLKDLNEKVERIADAHRTLNFRVDSEVQRFNVVHPDQSWNERFNDLEFKVNVTEKNAEEHCFYIEETLRSLINTSIEDVSSLIDQKFQLLENRLDEFGKNQASSDSSHSISSTVLQDVDDLKDAVKRLDTELKSSMFGKNGYLNNKEGDGESYQVLVQTQLGNSVLLKSLIDAMNEKFEQLQNKTSDLEALHSELGLVKFDLYKIEDNIDVLNEGFASMKDQLKNLDSAVKNTQLDLSAKIDGTKRPNNTSDTFGNDKCCSNLQDKFEVLKRNLTTDKGKCTDNNTQGTRTEIANIDARVSKLENVCGKLDTISGSLQRIKDGLNKHVTSLWNCIHNINGTIKSHSKDINGLKNSVQVFQTQVTKITTDLQDLMKHQPGAGTEPKQTTKLTPPPPRVTEKPRAPQHPVIPVEPQLPQEPTDTTPKPTSSKPEPPSPTGSIVIPLFPRRPDIIMEQGQAGPPGRSTQSGSGRQQGSNGQQEMELSKGFAGAPGYPKPAKESKDTRTITVFPESKGATATTALISFSAGITKHSFDVGLIPFNQVLVNDGDHYNPATGIFTAPIEGRYLVTAVLTPEQEQYLEAVLSVSNVSVAQLHTSGYRRELLEYSDLRPGRQICGGVGTFNLVLHLKAGDEVAIVLTGGKLASSDSDDMFSTFSGIFLYPSLFQR